MSCRGATPRKERSQVFWKLKERKGGPFRPPEVPRVPPRPAPPQPADPEDVLRPPKPPAPGGYRWEWSGRKKKRAK